MIVKICGIRTLEDGLAALEAGASMLGFNFYPPSPRYLAPSDCAPLVASLRTAGWPFQAVGVFVNTPPAEALRILATCGLDQAQFCGDETLAELAALDGRGFKALRPADPDQAHRQASIFARPSLSPSLLIDAFRPGKYGGTGLVGDWSLARRLATYFPLLLAGGLNPENAAQAVRQVHPWGLDTASGVESAPGVKDPQKILAFVRAALSAAQEINEC